METAIAWRSIRAWLLFGWVLVGSLLASGCLGPTTLSKEQIDHRTQEHFQRGMDQYQRGELRPALESFQLAKAYDVTASNPQIGEMIEKTESKLRIPGIASKSGVSPAPPAAVPPSESASGPQARAAGPTSTPVSPSVRSTPIPAAQPPPDGELRTHRSKVYTYTIDIPTQWGFTKDTDTIPGFDIEELGEFNVDDTNPRLHVLSLPLADDVDGRAFYEAMRKLLRASGYDTIDVGRRVVGGSEALLLRASATEPRGKLTSTIAVFSIEGDGWLLLFEADHRESERFQPLFHRMLDSFRASERDRSV